MSPAALQIENRLTPCQGCNHPIPWPLAPHGKPIFASAYAKRKFCSRPCHTLAQQQPRGKIKVRWDEALRRAEEREQGRAGLGPQVVSPPWGHECQVCGGTVRKGHPIHRAEPRNDLAIIRLTPA